METLNNLEPSQQFGYEYCIIKAAKLDSVIYGIAEKQLILRHAFKDLLGEEMHGLMKGVDKAQLIIF